MALLKLSLPALAHAIVSVKGIGKLALSEQVFGSDMKINNIERGSSKARPEHLVAIKKHYPEWEYIVREAIEMGYLTHEGKIVKPTQVRGKEVIEEREILLQEIREKHDRIVKDLTDMKYELSKVGRQITYIERLMEKVMEKLNREKE